MFKYSLDNKRYHTLNYDLTKRFNTRVFKVSLNGGFSCPNFKNNMGCIFCSKKGSGDFAGNKEDDLLTQFNSVKEKLNHKWPDTKYIAYFQANTNTYAPVNVLKEKFEQVITFPKVVGLNIGTRPDAISNECLEYLKDLNKRKLGRLIKRIQKDDLIIASELSRLGRNLLQIMGILHHCMNIGARIWTIKDNYRLGSDITSKVLAFAFGLSAEIERNLISQRTKEALARVRAEGRRVGRPRGSRNACKLEGREKYIVQKLSEGSKKNAIARRLHVHRDTLTRFIEQRGLKSVTNG